MGNNKEAYNMFRPSTIRNVISRSMTSTSVRAFSSQQQPEGGMNYGMFAGAAALAAGAAYTMNKKEATTASCAVTQESYPPNGLSANVRTLPGWIQAGCVLCCRVVCCVFVLCVVC